MLFTHLAKGEGKGVDGGVHNEAVEATHAYQEEAVRDQTAAAVEVARKRSALIEKPLSNCKLYSGQQMRELSVFWQVPQYVCVGVAEILISIPAYDLFYSEVPASLKSVCQALNLLTTTFGAMVAAVLNSVFARWLPDDLDDGHAERLQPVEERDAQALPTRLAVGDGGRQLLLITHEEELLRAVQ